MIVLLKSLALTVSLILLASASNPQRSSEPVERSLAVGSTFTWEAANYKHVIRLRAGDLRITIRPRETDGFGTPVVTVSAPGSQSVALSRSGSDASDLYDNLKIAVGRWDRAGHLFVMLTSYSGGAHCCTLLRLA